MICNIPQWVDKNGWRWGTELST